MCTCAHRATCCTCVCDLAVVVRNCDSNARVVVVLRIVTLVGGGHTAQILFWGFLIVGLHWPAGVCWVRNLSLWLGPERSRESLDGLCGHRAANWMNQVAFDDRISTSATGRSLLHDRAIDTPTLSPECHQPSHQSVIGYADTARSHTPQGLSSLRR